MAVIAERTIAVCVRVDLDADPSETADRFGQIARQNGASGVLLVAYSDDGERADRLLDPVLLGLEPIGVIDAIHADGRRWWSRTCADPRCCPPEGVAYDIDTSRLAAEAVYAGMTTCADRSELTRLVAGPAAEEFEALEDLAVRISVEVLAQPVRDRQRWLRCFIDEYVGRRSRSRPAELSEEDVARLACLTLDFTVRDEAWAMITREYAWIHLELWQQVVARSVQSLAPAPLCLLGTAAWVAGQGTLQVCCLERVQEIAPTYGMAKVLADINHRALPPAYWDSLREAFDETLAEQRGRRTRGRGIDGWPMPWDPGRNRGQI
jgi:hypothetical protein